MNGLTNRICVPHARGSRLSDGSSWLGRHRLNGCQDSPSVDGRCHLIVSIWLPETVLEVAKHSFVDILRYETATVSDNIGVTSISITKVAESRGPFVWIDLLELVTLVDVAGRCIICRLVACPG